MSFTTTINNLNLLTLYHKIFQVIEYLNINDKSHSSNFDAHCLMYIQTCLLKKISEIGANNSPEPLEESFLLYKNLNSFLQGDQLQLEQLLPYFIPKNEIQKIINSLNTVDSSKKDLKYYTNINNKSIDLKTPFTERKNKNKTVSSSQFLPIKAPVYNTSKDRRKNLKRKLEPFQSKEISSSLVMKETTDFKKSKTSQFQSIEPYVPRIEVAGYVFSNKSKFDNSNTTQQTYDYYNFSMQNTIQLQQPLTNTVVDTQSLTSYDSYGNSSKQWPHDNTKNYSLNQQTIELQVPFVNHCQQQSICESTVSDLQNLLNMLKNEKNLPVKQQNPANEYKNSTVNKNKINPTLLDLFVKSDLKIENPSVIASLYAELPIQCGSCGLRFKESGQKSQDHADWHFEKNTLKKKRETLPVSRQWYNRIDEWINEDLHNDKKNTKPMDIKLLFEKKNGNSHENDQKNIKIDKYLQQSKDIEVNEQQKECFICKEKFYEYWNDDRNKWLFENTCYLPSKQSNCKDGYNNRKILCHISCM